MATLDILWPFIKSFEGGFVNDPRDSGGATNMGVTLATWRKLGYDKDGDGDIDANDVRLINENDAKAILRKTYWDRWRATEIKDQSIANILVDWLWMSGEYGIKIPQRMLGVAIDGIVGVKTLAAVNAEDPRAFFASLHAERAEFFKRICQNSPSKKVYLNGWMRRLDSIQYGSLKLNTNPPRTVRF